MNKLKRLVGRTALAAVTAGIIATAAVRSQAECSSSTSSGNTSTSTCDTPCSANWTQGPAGYDGIWYWCCDGLGNFRSCGELTQDSSKDMDGNVTVTAMWGWCNLY